MSKMINKMLNRKQSIQHVSKRNKNLDEVIGDVDEVLGDLDEDYQKDYFQYNANTEYSDSIQSCGSLVNEKVSLYENRNNFKIQKQPQQVKTRVVSSEIQFVCRLCDNQSPNNQNYIILSCNHIYHVKCLADKDHADSKDCRVMDDEFFESRKCVACQTIIEKSEIIMTHTKFFKGTVEFINKHDENISRLEDQINKLKEELKSSIEYKQKLEYEREKSKQITTILNTIVLS